VLALSVAVLAVVQEMLQADVEMLQADVARMIRGPRGKHQTERIGYRHGSQEPIGTLVAAERPRARTRNAREVALPTWELFGARGLLEEFALGRMLVGLSTRLYLAGGEPVDQIELRGTSRSAVSRRFRRGHRRPPGAVRSGPARSALGVHRRHDGVRALGWWRVDQLQQLEVHAGLRAVVPHLEDDWRPGSGGPRGEASDVRVAGEDLVATTRRARGPDETNGREDPPHRAREDVRRYPMSLARDIGVNASDPVTSRVIRDDCIGSVRTRSHAPSRRLTSSPKS
jgi:hypothetical protein